MNELLFFLEIVLTFGCVVAAKKIFGKAGLIAWIAIAMILANLTVVKTVNLFGIDATLGNIMFASTFLAGDMLNENYGRQAAHKGILVGLGGVLVFMVCTQISLLYTPGAFICLKSSDKHRLCRYVYFGKLAQRFSLCENSRINSR